MTEQQYTQVLIKKTYREGPCQSYVVWIPTKLARVGAYLKIKNDNSTWTDGWEVKERYATKDAAYVMAKERDYLHQAEASDI